MTTLFAVWEIVTGFLALGVWADMCAAKHRRRARDGEGSLL